MERMDLYNADRSILKPTHFVKILLFKNELQKWTVAAFLK